MPSTAHQPIPLLHRPVVLRGIGTQVICGLIALMLALQGGHGAFGQALVYSLLIGNACWLFIDGGRLLVARVLHAGQEGRSGWPGWRWMVPLTVGGTLGGYLLGGTLGDLWFGKTTTQVLLAQPALLLSVLAALAMSATFYARERLHAQRLAAEAAERLASETHLKLLQSQLEPHMLFNTLANLRVLIGLDPPQAQAMLDHLVAFLRTTLSSTRNGSHALSAEFAALADYLALMAVRMGPRLQARFDLPDALRQVPVPPLLLQPLVENAIQHGLEPKVAGGRIDISASQDGPRITLRVRDTGVGLAAAHGASKGTKFGVDQVRQRLQQLYGDAASLDLRPADDADGGTEVVIALPCSSDHSLP
jgi:signal transduction histidine kinase